MKDLLYELTKLESLSKEEFQNKLKVEKPVESIFRSMRKILTYDYDLLSNPLLNLGILPTPNSTLQLEGYHVDNNGKPLIMSCIEVGIEEEFAYSFLLEIIGEENKLGSGRVNNPYDLSGLFSDIEYIVQKL